MCRLRPWWVWLWFFCLVVAFFPGLTSLRRLPAAKDTLTFSYPAQVELSRALRAGEFPLWSTHLNSPLFAEGQGAFAHPLALLLFAVFPAVAASDLFLLIHIYAGLAFTYLLCRELGQSKAAAAFAAPAFIFGAYFLTRLGIYTVITNGIWLPGLLWLALRFCKTGDLRYALAAGCGGGLALLAGQFQLAVYAIIGATAFILAGRRNWRRRILAVALTSLFPVALAAVQLLPTFELWRLSERALASRTSDYSFWPPQFLSLLVADLFGRSPHPPFASVSHPVPDYYWGRSSFVESGLYVGALPLTFAVTGLAARRRWFFIIAAAAAAAFSCGIFLPLFKIYEQLPPLNLFRAPGRLLLFTTLALAVCAGDGYDAAFKDKAKTASVVGIALALAAAVLFFGVALARPKLEAHILNAARAMARIERNGESPAIYEAKAREKIRRLAEATRWPAARPALQLGFWVVAAGIPTGLVFSRPWRKVAPAAALFAAAADLFWFNWGINPTTDASSLKSPTAMTGLKPAAGERIFSSGYELTGAPQLGLGLIHANAHAIWGYDLLVPRASLRPAAAAAVLERLENMFTEPALPTTRRPTACAPPLNAFRTFGIKYYVKLKPWLKSSARLLAKRGPYHVYADDESMPQAWLIYDYEVIPDDAAALDRIVAQGFEPSRTAVLAAEPLPSVKTHPPNSTPSVNVARPSRAKVVCSVVTRTPGILILNDLFFPGWEARVDGEPAAIYRANVIARAVVVPAGKHVVEFTYRPWTFYAGLAASVLACLTAAGGFFYLATNKKNVAQK